MNYNYQGFPVNYNPNFNNQYPYGMPQNAPQMPQSAPQTPQMDDRLYVAGEQEAAAWVVQRGQSARLWDRNGQTFYVKTVSESGQPLPLEIYDYRRRGGEPAKSEPVFNPDDYVTRNEFDDFKRQFSRRKKKEEVIIDAEAE